MSAFTEEQLQLVSQKFSPLFKAVKFEALDSDGQRVKGDSGIVAIRCRIPLDSSKSMIEAALGVGGTDYQKHAVAALKLFLESKPQAEESVTEFGWHVGEEAELDFLNSDYSLYWYKPGGNRQGGIQICLSLRGADSHMNLRKPAAKKAAPAPAPAPAADTDTPWGPK